MILEKADKTPPLLCRLVARDKTGWHPLSTREIAKRSGIPVATVGKISKLKSWATVPIGVAEKFAKACGVNLSQPSKTIKWLRKAKMSHIRFSNPKQRKLFADLMRG